MHGPWSPLLSCSDDLKHGEASTWHDTAQLRLKVSIPFAPYERGYLCRQVLPLSPPTAPQSHPATPRGATEGRSRKVLLRANIDKLIDIDPMKQTFTAQIFLEGTVKDVVGAADEKEWKSFTNKFMSRVDFANSIKTSKESDCLKDGRDASDRFSIQGQDLVWKKLVTATFGEHMELEDFPMDRQKLSIFVKSGCPLPRPGKESRMWFDLEESKEKRSQVNRQHFFLQNIWSFSDKLKIEFPDGEEANGCDDTFQTIQISMEVTRKYGFHYWNIVLPMFLIVMMGMTSFWVPKERIADRLQVTLMLVLTAVAFKFTVSNMVPAISYMTLLDTYIIACWMFLFIMVMENGMAATWFTDEAEADFIKILGRLWALTNACFAGKVIRILIRQKSSSYVTSKRATGKSSRTTQQLKSRNS